MGSGMWAVYASGGIVILSMVVVYAVTRHLFRKPEVSMEVRDNSRWQLGFVAKKGRKYRLGLKFVMTFTGSEDNYSLVVDYTCTAPDGTHLQERAGIGHLTEPACDREVKTIFNSHFSSVFGKSRHRAQFVVAAVGPFREDTEVTASGRILHDQGSALEHGEIFFS